MLSTQRVDNWAQSAEQLKAFMDALSATVSAGPYGLPLAWKSYQEMDVELWHDLSAIERELVDMRNTNDDGTLAGANPDSHVVVQAYLDRGSDTDFSDSGQLLNLRATLGHDAEFPSIDGKAEFYVGERKQPALPLQGHDPGWLVQLISTAAASVSADRARIITDSLHDAIADRRILPLGLGVLSLAPHGIDLDLPASLTAYPCPTGYPDGQVIVADLDRAATDPESLVDDLLLLNEALEAAG
ncbi:hypothetical protein [Microlunatus parietis]|uniref:Uncharacterized protein n=1 Tax=Microlunatus parietis TaxID=682979 RepID=A0A7Y9I7H4_9ACTN|nr:hypothetical protein [Microlunatus parietis]NYE71421.1 hypothetical protein [Microlunatus parietis]